MDFAGRYRIVESYRKDGGREVHLVEDLREEGRRKVLKVSTPGEPATEFEALRGLDHPGLASILECGTEGGRPYLTREFAEGGDFTTLAPLDPKEATAVLVEVARALGYLHARGVVHLDLKPANVLRVRSDSATPIKLADFGLASRPGESASGGTVFFAAPEVFRREEIDGRADLFSLGVLLAHLLHGPFQVGPGDFYRDFPQKPFLEAAGIDATAWPSQLGDLVARLTEADRTLRPARAAEVLRFLNRHRSRPIPVETPETARSALRVDPLVPARPRVDSWTATALRSAKGEPGPRLFLALGPDGCGAREAVRQAAARLSLADVAVHVVEGTTCDSPRTLRSLLRRSRHESPPEATEAAPGLDPTSAPAAAAIEGIEAAAGDLLGLGRSAVAAIVDLHLPDDGVIDAVLRAGRGLKTSPSGPVLLASVDPTSLSARHQAALEALRPSSAPIRMEGLAEEEVEGFLRALPGAPRGRDMLHNLARDLRAATGGSPALLSEALVDLFDRGLITFGEDGLSFGAIDRSAIGTPSELLEARAARLPRAAAHALSVLLAGGGSMFASTLFGEGGATPEGFATLREIGWAVGPDRAGEIRLRPDLSRSLSRLPTPPPRTCGDLADAMRASGVPPERLAPLLLLAGRTRDGVAAALAGAERLRFGSAFAGAVKLLQGALSRAPGDARLPLALAETHLVAAEPAAAVAALDRLAPLDGVPAATRGLAIRARGEALALLGRNEEALAALREARNALPSPSPFERVRRARAEAFVHSRLGTFEEAERALEEASAGLSGVDKGRLLTVVGFFRFRRGDLEGARAILEEASGRLREAGDEFGTADALVNLGVVLRRAGETRAAVEALREARSLCPRAGRYTQSARAAHNLGVALKDLGLLQEAREPLLEALALRESMGDPAEVAETRASLGILELERGDAARALALLDEAQRTFRSTQLSKPSAAVLVRRGEALLALDRPTEARESFLGALALPAGQEIDPERLDAEVGLVLLDVVAGSTDDAAERLRRLEADHPGLPDPRARANLARAAVRVALARGNAAEARERIAALRGTGAEGTGELDLLDGLVRELAGERDEARGAYERAADRAARAGALGTRAQAAAAAACLLAVEGDRAAFRERLHEFEEAAAVLGLAHSSRRLLLGADLDRRLAAAERGEAEAAKPDAPGLSLEAMRTVLAINKRLIGGASRDDLLRFILESAVALVNARRGFLLLLRGNAIEFEGTTSLDRGPIPGPAREISHSIVHRAVRDGKPVLTTNARSDERFGDLRSVADLDLRSVACVPFRTEEGTSGALYVDNPVREAVFTDRTLDLLEALADQAALALAAVRRREEVERLNDQLRGRLREQEVALRAAEADRTGDRAPAEASAIVARSVPMQAVLDTVARVAPTDLSLLLEGDSGTGKELLAREIHRRSRRAARPFVTINCAAVPETLLESEFFGSVKGAFTGADRDRPGLLEAADGGTLFLDEIGEMPFGLQAKLLRALQEGEFRPVGGHESKRADVRLLAATNRDLGREIAAGKFREDLYYRLRGASIRLPSLGDRPEDLPALVEAFLERLNARHGASKTLAAEVRRALARRPWPGNVRELENEVARLFFLSGDAIEDPSLVSAPALARPLEGEAAVVAVKPMEELEAEAIALALRESGGDKDAAARRLGIARATIYAKIRKYGIPV
ncbi:MAG: sigma 54-interacting transcriptional regulator [Planctomycetes bacterium]|nr:sigma 54-interacting transcriptional regulator [Planctomycetota bacterium]